MSKLHIDDLSEVDQYASYPDEQEVVVSLGMLRELSALQDLATPPVTPPDYFQVLQEQREEEARQIAELDRYGKLMLTRMERVTRYEAEFAESPLAYQNWEWRKFGESARWRPCTRPLDWSIKLYDFRRKP